MLQRQPWNAHQSAVSQRDKARASEHLIMPARSPGLPQRRHCHRSIRRHGCSFQSPVSPRRRQGRPPRIPTSPQIPQHANSFCCSQSSMQAYPICLPASSRHADRSALRQIRVRTVPINRRDDRPSVAAIIQHGLPSMAGAIEEEWARHRTPSPSGTHTSGGRGRLLIQSVFLRDNASFHL